MNTKLLFLLFETSDSNHSSQHPGNQRIERWCKERRHLVAILVTEAGKVKIFPRVIILQQSEAASFVPFTRGLLPVAPCYLHFITQHLLLMSENHLRIDRKIGDSVWKLRWWIYVLMADVLPVINILKLSYNFRLCKFMKYMKISRIYSCFCILCSYFLSFLPDIRTKNNWLHFLSRFKNLALRWVRQVNVVILGI